MDIWVTINDFVNQNLKLSKLLFVVANINSEFEKLEIIAYICIWLKFPKIFHKINGEQLNELVWVYIFGRVNHLFDLFLKEERGLNITNLKTYPKK